MLRSLRDLLVFNNVLSCLVSRQHNPLILKEASVTYFRTRLRLANHQISRVNS